MSNYKYKLSVLAMFKNESWIIKEWIEHYISEGVNHFYLIDNGSNDDYESKIQSYMNKITLVKDPSRLEKNTQSMHFKNHFLNIIKKETEWIIVCDIDEYIYARNNYKKISDKLNSINNNIEKIWLPWKIFGSNGHIKQPSNIKKSFIKREDSMSSKKKDLGHGKCISRTRNIINFGTCGHNIQINGNNKEYLSNGEELDKFEYNENNLNKLDLHLNHYMLLSEEYYLEIKCKRGGGESGLSDKYKISFFHDNNKFYNKTEDTELANKKY